MNRKDLIFILIALTIFLPFILIDSFFQAYVSFNHDYPMIMSMIKFAILATMGEALGSRIKSGKYTQSGFGLFP